MPITKSVRVVITTTGEKDAAIRMQSVRDWADRTRKAVTDPMEIKLIGLAAASAQFAILRSEARRTAAAVSDTGGGFNLLGKLGITGGGAGLKGLPGIGGIVSGMGPTGIAATAAAALMLAGAIAQIIPPLAAAGIGLAAFGALAIPTFTAVTTAAQKLSTATSQQARDKIWAGLPAAIRPVVRVWQDLVTVWHQATTALAPTVLAIMNEGLKIAGKLLPLLEPIAKTAGNAILGLLKQFDKFASSPGFKAFMDSMNKLAGPAITAIGQGLGQVAVALGKMLVQMSGPNGIATIKGLFDILALAIRGLGDAFTFANKLNTGFAIGMLATAQFVLGAFKFMADGVLGALGAILHGMVLTFGWIPNIGDKLRAASRAFDGFKTSFDNTLAGARAALARWEAALRNAPKVFTLKGDITDLQQKIATGLALLRNPHLTATQRAKIEADISGLQRQLAIARAQLALLTGTPWTVVVNTLWTGGSAGHPHAALGGFASGATWVGERGPELVSLPSGSYVHTAAESKRMTAGGNTYNVTVNTLVADRQTGAKVVEAIRAFEQGSGSGWRAA